MARPVASDSLPESPHYRRDAFREGLARCGYLPGQPPKAKPERHDVLLVWNRGRASDADAKRYEAAGARVIVAENGYIGKDSKGWQLYAMALWHHAGAGDWPDGDEDRWTPLGVGLRPWRKDGREIVVLPQRGFGPAGIAMPQNWVADVVERLKKVTDRPIRVRPHPGKDKTDPVPDLSKAWAAVTWASGAGIKAVVGGIPVFHELPTWIGRDAAREGIAEIENPFLGDRLPMLRRLSWAQWSEDEIRSGKPFKWLL